MKSGRWKATSLVLVACISASGCTTTGGAGGGSSALDGAVARCVASALGGAVLGGLLGAATGGRNRVAAGAAAGAAIGGLTCAVLTALDAQDKARIRQAQIEAASLNQTRYVTYNGSDGRARKITVKPAAAANQTIAGETRLCRPTDTDIDVDGAGSTSVPAQLVCRTSKGEWLPA